MGPEMAQHGRQSLSNQSALMLNVEEIKVGYSAVVDTNTTQIETSTKTSN